MKKLLFSISVFPLLILLGKSLGKEAMPSSAPALPPGNKTMIILQENGGRLVYIDDYISGKTQTLIESVIDKTAETFESVKSALQSVGYYTKVINLTDANCTRVKLLDNLIAETKAGKQVDLFIFGHGGTDKLSLFGTEKLTGGPTGNIRSLLSEARTKENNPKFNFNLRLVYMANCVGGSTNDDWVAAGADASVGSICYNAMPEPMITLFTNKFVRENKTASVAANEAYNESVFAWQTFSALYDLKLDEPPPAATGCSSFRSVYASSKPVVTGNGALKFNPAALSIVQVFENTTFVAGEAIQSAVDAGATAAGNAVESIQYNASNIFANVMGTVIPEGNYYLKCLKGGKNLKVYQSDCQSSDGNGVVLHSLGSATCDNKFTIKKAGVGYSIKCAGKFLEVKAEELLQNSGRVQMWGPNLPLSGHAPNQIWWFFEIPNQKDKYIIRNVGSQKVLDANNSCTSENDCRVKQWDAINNDATQVWVAEKIKS
jgi:hypothetical protein